MMGRSHAMLGAVAYAALTPMAMVEASQVTQSINDIACNKTDSSCFAFKDTLHALATPITMDRPTMHFIWAGLVILAFLFTNIFGSDGRFKNFIYRLIQIVVVFLGMFLIVQFLFDKAPYLFPQTPVDRMIWLFCAAGFSLAPDLDEPNSTVARLFGPFSRGFSAITRKIAGGHRYATHSWIFAVLGLLLAMLSQVTPIVMGFTLMCAFILSSRMILPDSLKVGAIPLAVIAAFVAWLAAIGSIDPRPMLLAVPAGILLHDLGDWMTNSGIAFTYPSRKKYAAKWFSTNGGFEHYVVQPVLSVASLAILVFWIAVPTVSMIATGKGAEIFQDMPSFGGIN